MRSPEVTPKALYVRRREFLKLGAGSALALSLPAFAKAKVEHGAKLPGVRANPSYALAEEKKTPFEDITTYNNFYELGTDKSDPSENAAKLQTAKMAPTRRWKTKMIRLTMALNTSRFEGTERNVTNFSLLNLFCDTGDRDRSIVVLSTSSKRLSCFS